MKHTTLVTFAGLALLSASSCADDDDGASARAKQCERMRDHLIDLRLEGTQDQAAHREAMKQALGTEFVTSCTATMTSTEVACTIKANDSDAVMRCSSAASSIAKK